MKRHRLLAWMLAVIFVTPAGFATGLWTADQDQNRALVNRVNNARDLLFAADYTAGSAVHMTGSLLVGLSNRAPNYGFSGGTRFQF